MNKSITSAIVVIAYNRPNSLARLLESINNAKYQISNIPLIISIDFAENNKKVYQIADKFIWNYGLKKVIKNHENLGLRKHVLKCGDLTNIYGSIIMLEDDLYVSPNFYEYAVSALKFSENKNYLAGISLYNHPVNVHTNEVFKPLEDGYDNYYFQFASSWGQAWTKEQWSTFKVWYEENQTLTSDTQIPKNVTDWSDKSWLKYFTVYLIKTNKYFLYPKVSLSTNFSDAGTHVGFDTTSYQTALKIANQKDTIFSSIDESQSVYDAFYENTQLNEFLGLEKDELCVDLYGYKKEFTLRYCLSTQLLNYKIIKIFGRSLKPLDANILFNIKGVDIFLYDISVQQKNPHKINHYRRLLYNLGHLSFKNSFLITRKLYFLKIKTIFGVG